MNTGTFIEVDLVFDMWEGNSYMIDSPVLNEASEIGRASCRERV
jgi:hypothetical protein